MKEGAQVPQPSLPGMVQLCVGKLFGQGASSLGLASQSMSSPLEAGHGGVGHSCLVLAPQSLSCPGDTNHGREGCSFYKLDFHCLSSPP